LEGLAIFLKDQIRKCYYTLSIGVPIKLKLNKFTKENYHGIIPLSSKNGEPSFSTTSTKM
jgi:hypothetical protein